MISINLAETIHSQFASEFEVHAIDSNKYAVETPFLFPDGDHCGMHIVVNEDGSWYITDDGTSMMRASYAGADLLSAGYNDRFRRIIGFYGITEKNGVLMMPGRESKYGDGVMAFTQACIDVVRISKMPKERSSSTKNKFSASIEKLINRHIPSSSISRRWHHEVHDPDKVYLVDFRLSLGTKPWFIYCANTPMHCLRAAVSCLHYKRKKLPFSSAAIYDPELEIPKTAKEPLEDAIDKPLIMSNGEVDDFLVSIKG